MTIKTNYAIKSRMIRVALPVIRIRRNDYRKLLLSSFGNFKRVQQRQAPSYYKQNNMAFVLVSCFDV